RRDPGGRAAAAGALRERRGGGRDGGGGDGVTDDLRAAVAWTGDAVEIIDQTKLPAEEVVLRLETPEEVVDAIRRLAVRGAPAIGICGALGVVVAAAGDRRDEGAAMIRATRPTAVNLAWAVDRVLAAADAEAEALAI